MPNILTPQGSLTRLKSSAIWNDFPSLNVTAPFLGKTGIRLTLEGETTLFLPTMTGAATSQEPYLMCSIRMHLLKTQGLSSQYKAKMQTNSQLGAGTVRPDVGPGGLDPYSVINCAIESVEPLDFSGDSVDFIVTVKGYYIVNSDAFDA